MTFMYNVAPGGKLFSEKYESSLRHETDFMSVSHWDQGNNKHADCPSRKLWTMQTE